MTLEEDMDELIDDAVSLHSQPDDSDVFRRRLRSFLAAVRHAAGDAVTVGELLETMPDFDA